MRSSDDFSLLCVNFMNRLGGMVVFCIYFLDVGSDDALAGSSLPLLCLRSFADTMSFLMPTWCQTKLELHFLVVDCGRMVSA